MEGCLAGGRELTEVLAGATAGLLRVAGRGAG